MKPAIWKLNGMVSLRLRDNLFTIGQMSVNGVMRLFDVSNTDDVWDDQVLADARPLFDVFVGRVVIQNLAIRRIPERSVQTVAVPPQRLWIKPYLCYDGKFPFRGGKLVDLGPDGTRSSTDAPAIKENLQLPEDRHVIEHTELTNMWGEHSLGDRLRRYFDTGVNRDDLKFEVFPGLWNDRERLRPLTCRLPIPLR